MQLFYMLLIYVVTHKYHYNVLSRTQWDKMGPMIGQRGPTKHGGDKRNGSVYASGLVISGS